VEEKAEHLRKFVVDFEGDILKNVSSEQKIEAVVSASRAEIVHTTVSPIQANGAWRLVIDLVPESDAPVELSGYLSLNGLRLSEIWTYQWRRTDGQS